MVIELVVYNNVSSTGSMDFIAGEAVLVTNAQIEATPPKGYPPCPARNRCADGTSLSTHRFNHKSGLIEGEVCAVFQQPSYITNKIAACRHCRRP